MSYVIAVRLPKEKGSGLVILRDNPDDDLAAEFINETDAEHAAENNMLCMAYGYEIIELDC